MKHMVRIHAEDPDGTTLDEARAAVNDWVNNHNEWVEDEITHEINRYQRGYDGTGTVYLRGDFRFHADSTSATVLLDDAEQSLKGSVGWYRLCYHACGHDGDTSVGDCQWNPDETREHGSNKIPSDIPTCE